MKKAIAYPILHLEFPLMCKAESSKTNTDNNTIATKTKK